MLSAEVNIIALKTEGNKDIVTIRDTLGQENGNVTEHSGTIESVVFNVTNSPGISVAFRSDVSVNNVGFKIAISIRSDGVYA